MGPGPWHGAKKIMVAEHFPGRMSELLYYVSRSEADRLSRAGYPNLDAILAEEPVRLPLPRTKTGLRQCAILHTQRTGISTPVRKELVPPQKRTELFVDFEYLNNTNVRMEEEWPELKGRDMVFMIGIGQMTREGWAQTILTAESETSEAEAKLFLSFVEHLNMLGVIENPNDFSIYHWCPPERWQTQRFIDRVGGRLGFQLQTALSRFIDLREVFHAGNISIPGAMDYGLKTVAKALSAYDTRFAAEWPDGVTDGTQAMVAGGRMYEVAEPLHSVEYEHLARYLEIDCFALHKILSWLRAKAE